MLARAMRGASFGLALALVAVAGPVTRPALAPAVFAAAPPGRDGPVIERVPFPSPKVILADPSRLLIPSLAIDAQVEGLGVDGTGAMETPQNLWNVGWFKPGPSPGAEGDAVIDGHVGLPGYPLIFSNLSLISPGAELIVVYADGTRGRFTVTGLSSWPADSEPPGLFATTGPARLSLITCTGRYDSLDRTYADRLIVEAEYAGSA